MMVITWQWRWLGNDAPLDTIRTDPSRMAQGIMTGIGILGAGVILEALRDMRHEHGFHLSTLSYRYGEDPQGWNTAW